MFNASKGAEMKNEAITLAGGCFWCIEAVFKRLKGVESVLSGYAGDGKANPTYDEVSAGNTGYTEALQIHFDPSVISLEKIFDVYWAVHDPTTLNRQGNDTGPQYRSAIFYSNTEQKNIALKSIEQLKQSGKFKDPIVTALEPFKQFYEAEQYHRDFYDKNREYGYCKLVIDPKITKLYKDFKEELKEEYLDTDIY
ncbi:MAG: peptide methionine sulfoxide reductase [Candidatus Doudnabacteria bacterium Gr01-1014_77]|uniref:Peptide methionine sulfoxide reductase MsrA n=1 Tax=Candidatus Doudnabacteria bacterium Gr01-1014_77 TaxID=2017133 RepID=A0A554JD95_9BACT|nr:MAG: peptide methionine sulfoxide reductase [Candidatus Doudnabacteria bacterium Gr01-1014_77]